MRITIFLCIAFYSCVCLFFGAGGVQSRHLLKLERFNKVRQRACDSPGSVCMHNLTFVSSRLDLATVTRDEFFKLDQWTNHRLSGFEETSVVIESTHLAAPFPLWCCHVCLASTLNSSVLTTSWGYPFLWSEEDLSEPSSTGILQIGTSNIFSF